MLLSERIQERVERLPARLQTQVLDFVEYLLAKAEREAVQHERRDWSRGSLASALRGMEEEDGPTYTPADLKVVFS
jgi:hypothetical protein